MQFAIRVPPNSFPPIHQGTNSSSRYTSRSSAMAIRQFAFSSNSRFPPIRVLHAGRPGTYQRDTIRVSSNSNSSSSATPTRDTIRNSPKFVFPPIPIPILRGTCQRAIIRVSLQFAFPQFAFPPILVHHASAATPAPDTIRVPLQCQFEFIMLAFPSNGHSLQFASPPIRILHHANEPAIAKRDTICVPPNSCSSTRRRTNSSPKFNLRSLPIPNCNSSCWRTSTCQRDIIRLSLQFAFPSNPSSHSSNSCKRTSACMRYNAFPPIPLRVHHAGAPAAAKRDTVRFMLAHHFQLESHFAIPIQVMCWRSNSLARDTIHVPLQIQLIFIMLQLALHHLHKIQFAFSPNSN